MRRKERRDWDEGNRWGREGGKGGHEGCGERKGKEGRERGGKGEGKEGMETDLFL